MNSPNDYTADVCLVIEGAYPYVPGGVSGWVHDLIRAHGDMSFHIVSLVTDDKPRRLRYELPENVVDLQHVSLQDLRPGARRVSGATALFERLEAPLKAIQKDGGLEQLGEIIGILAEHEGVLGSRVLLDSEAAFACLERMYEETMPSGSFLHYFWTWRSLFGGLFATLVAPLPRTRVYHGASTGYAGLLLARAKLQTGRPVMVTEHGIYTNERRIEILMADWLFDQTESGLSIKRRHRDLRDLWVHIFQQYALLCYQACDHIITLYEGNQRLQLQTGAPADRLRIIPNGIDYPRYAAVERETGKRRPTVGLIGRVAPIKDIKTFLSAIGLLREDVPDLRALIIGPTDEDDDYYEECRALTTHLGLDDVVEYTGCVDIRTYLGGIDILVLTSISEAQPLVILEAGAAGVPVVATDVGSCRELIEGRSDESPPLGPGGAVTSVAAPQEIAGRLHELLADDAHREACGRTLRRRVHASYNKTDIDRIYGELYWNLMGDDGRSPRLRRVV